MTPSTVGNESGSQDEEQPGSPTRPRQGDLAALARDLVDKVGIEGAIRYCRSLGWRGVLDQVEMLKHGH